MSTQFDESKVRRGGADNPGQFATKFQAPGEGVELGPDEAAERYSARHDAAVGVFVERYGLERERAEECVEMAETPHLPEERPEATNARYLLVELDGEGAPYPGFYGTVEDAQAYEDKWKGEPGYNAKLYDLDDGIAYDSIGDAAAAEAKVGFEQLRSTLNTHARWGSPADRVTVQKFFDNPRLADSVHSLRSQTSRLGGPQATRYRRAAESLGWDVEPVTDHRTLADGDIVAYESDADWTSGDVNPTSGGLYVMGRETSPGYRATISDVQSGIAPGMAATEVMFSPKAGVPGASGARMYRVTPR